MRPGDPVRLVRPWNGHSRGTVVTMRGDEVRVEFQTRHGRVVRSFARTAVMSLDDVDTARSTQVARDRAIQVTRVRFLTCWQPWASFIAWGVKVNETRGWPTSFRGWLGIHAGAKIPAEARHLMQLAEFQTALAEQSVTLEQLPRGAVVAIARVYDCVSTTAAEEGWRGHPRELAFGNYDPGRYAWLLKDVRALPAPIPVKGAQGLWDCDWLPAAINASLGEEVLPTTESGRQAFYRGGLGEPRALVEGPR